MSRLIAGILANLIIGAIACATELKKGNSVNTHPSTLWQMIETLIDHPSYTLETIGQVLPIKFAESSRSAYTSFYEGGPLHLADHVMIETIHLGIRHEDGTSRWLGLDFDPNGVCVTLDEVHLHYPDINIIGAPRGGSLDEATYWAVQWSWGRVALGFKERNPRCLAHVAIDRSKPPSTSTD